MRDAALMQHETEEVLRDPLFNRSPVLSRLLSYLVEASIRGEGKHLKSYAVAVDGLGKADTFDAQSDSYARVQVVRLRRALDAYYAGVGADHPRRLTIASGSYEVTLEAMSQPGGDAAAEAAPVAGALDRGRPSGKAIAGLLAALVMIAGLLAWYLHARESEDLKRWQQGDFPVVAITVSQEAGLAPANIRPAEVRRFLEGHAARYEAVRISNTNRGDYVIDVVLSDAGADIVADIELTKQADDRVIWAASEHLDKNRLGKGGDGLEPLSAILFRVFQPTGVIHSSARRWRSDADTPYGCWLRFGALLQENRFFNDAALDECSARWFAAAPNHPLAAALRGWALASASVDALTDAGRRETLAQAIEVVERARSVSPGSPALQVSAMRVHAMAGNRQAVVDAARRAMALNPDSLDLRGAAGTYLDFYNVEEGEALLDSAIRHHFNPPGWYFTGKFVAAMMRDDPESAGAALERLRALGQESAVLSVLGAAVAARRGDVRLAKAEWAKAVQIQPLLRFNEDFLFSRLPVAPEVRDRLKEWLEPVFRKD